MPTARINGIQLYYEVHGQGPAVVFAHGAGGNHLSWWQQVPVFSQRYTCITFDHRSYGQSVDDPAGVGMRGFVDDLRALLDHLGIRDVYLVAQSMGGFTCLGFAVRWPERVKALVLADTTGGIADLQLLRQQRERRQAPDYPKDLLARVLSAGFRRRYPERAFLYAQVSALNPPRPENFLEPLWNGEGPTAEEVARLRVPVLLIGGAEDPLTTPDIMRLVHKLIPSSRLVLVPGAGHSVYWEKPGIFNRLVQTFFDRVT
ncbi:MAG: alpha/beta hydrolase [Dehalococcoidia bacterium]|nr:alpha/beta hydrolase [Dehalococcoidia bacterium]MDW8119074.1 alpha/beta hydrolase [Chloroflexota bacterium]